MGKHLFIHFRRGKPINQEELESLARDFLDNYTDSDISFTPDEVSFGYEDVRKMLIRFYGYCSEKNV